MKWITSSDTKNDPVDARKLALLARADVRLLAPVEYRTAEQQAELAVIRARDAMLRARTLLINSARSIAKGFGLRLPKSITGTFGARAIEALPEFLRTALTGRLEQIDTISGEIAGYDQKGERASREASGTGAAGKCSRRRPAHRDDVRADARPRRPIRAQPRCSGVSGAGAEAAAERPRDPQLGISKSGDPYLRKLLVQCAHHILGHYGKDSALRQWGLTKGEGGKKATLRAIVAVARKLSVLLHRLWVSGEFYKPFPKTA